ncbi:hypothetical protein BOX37_03190 [Nocardia mangyaensis]|uniref:Mammalian cell entry protein n=1 Tax=Nocardia mangyaensis TaxID=2213200 RepID=A0A1J0VM92_9NOCA|nr:hypothetical protein [Nocardia mangyaensis]APE33134.1 hypothetical protein BOX37_03190 [Nocardia mangyaensis]
MIDKRLRLLCLATAVLLAGGAVAACAGPDSAPTGIALVNADTGPTGERVVKAVQDAGGYEWTVAKPGEIDAGDYAAVITLPADLTSSMATLATLDPQRAKVTVTTHDGADQGTVNGAVDVVTHRIGASGVDAALAAVSQARNQMTSVQFTAQLLNAGVNAAAAGADQFSGGAEEMLGFLDFAKEGAGQLTSAIELLNQTVDGAAKQADQLADALDATGVTIAGVQNSAAALGAGLDQILPLLHALPFAGDPQLADIITKLEALRGVSNQAGTQLDGLSELTGAAVDPNTELGTLLRTVVDRLNSARDQLTQGAELAEGLPALAEQGGAQLVSAIEQLTGGVGALQNIVGNLTDQTGKALDALPPRGQAQQSALALALTDPVEVVRE